MSRMLNLRFFSSAWIAALTLCAPAFGQEYRIGDMRIDQAYARPTVAAQTAGAVYVSVQNLGKTPDQLVSAASTASQRAELHTMSMQDNVMKMREVPNIEIKPSEKIVMAPGHGFHIMLMGLKQPLKTGDKLPLTLRFKNAGAIDMQVTVEDKSAGTANGMKPGMTQHR